MYGTCEKCKYYTWLDDTWNLCYNCANPQVFKSPQQFNYECPDCHGKFNIAAYVNDGTSTFSWRCPFCGRKLEGL